MIGGTLSFTNVLSATHGAYTARVLKVRNIDVVMLVLYIATSTILSYMNKVYSGYCTSRSDQ